MTPPSVAERTARPLWLHHHKLHAVVLPDGYAALVAVEQHTDAIALLLCVLHPLPAVVDGEAGPTVRVVEGCLQLEPGHSVITKICRSPHICSRIRKPTSRPGPWRTRTRHVEKARARTHPAAGRVTPVSLTPRGGSASRCLPAERWPTCCDLGFVPANRSPSTCSTRPPWT